MQFGLFASTQANSGDIRPRDRRGLPRLPRLQRRGRGARLSLQLPGRAPFHRLEPGLRHADAARPVLAMRTTTLRVGTAVMVLPWHNPVLLAEQAATLDLISGGRLDFGVGKGYRHSEFRGFCIPRTRRTPRFEEAIEVITRSWTSRERFSHRGRFWQFDDIVVEPPPAQQPHPPFWVAAGKRTSIRRAAARGFNLILDQYASTEAIGERIALYRAEREAHGRLSIPCRSRSRASSMSRRISADAEAALARQAHTRSGRSTCRVRPAAKAARTCWPMPTRPAARRRTRSMGRPMRLPKARSAAGAGPNTSC